MKIPQYTAREQIPRSSGQPLERPDVSGVGQGISSIGRSVFNLGLDIAENNLRMQKQDEDNKIANLAIQFDNDLVGDYIDYHNQKGDNAYGSQERLDAFQDRKTKELTKGIDNPRVVQGITQHVQTRVSNRRIDYASYESQQRGVVSELTRDMNLDTAAQSAFNGIGSLEENLETVRNLIKTQHDNGEISAETSEAWLLDAERKVAERTLAGIVNRQPDASVELMQSGVFNKYLDSKTIEHYTNEARQEASRQTKIQEAAIKRQQEERESVANKEMSDALLDGKLNTELLGKHREAFTPEQYKSWVKEYDSQIDNLKKSVDEEKAKTVEAELYVKALTSDQLSTQQGQEAFKQEIAGRVARRELDPVKARQLLNDTTEVDKGNPERKAAIKQSIDSIEVAYKNGILGDGMESTIEREKMVRDLRAWSIQNPDKDPVEFTEKVLTAKREHWIKGLFRMLPGVSLFTSPPAESQTAQEARLEIMKPPPPPKRPYNFLREFPFGFNSELKLPTKEELAPLIKDAGIKTQSEAVEFIKNKYGITKDEALSYYRGLK